jgi:hypothetical protein
MNSLEKQFSVSARSVKGKFYQWAKRTLLTPFAGDAILHLKVQ